jgi:hypothetical protein
MYVRDRCNFTDHMVVVTGRSERHIRAMAEAVVSEVGFYVGKESSCLLRIACLMNDLHFLCCASVTMPHILIVVC